MIVERSQAENEKAEHARRVRKDVQRSEVGRCSSSSSRNNNNSYSLICGSNNDDRLAALTVIVQQMGSGRSSHRALNFWYAADILLLLDENVRKAAIAIAVSSCCAKDHCTTTFQMTGQSQNHTSRGRRSSAQPAVYIFTDKYSDAETTTDCKDSHRNNSYFLPFCVLCCCCLSPSLLLSLCSLLSES